MRRHILLSIVATVFTTGGSAQMTPFSLDSDGKHEDELASRYTVPILWIATPTHILLSKNSYVLTHNPK